MIVTSFYENGIVIGSRVEDSNYILKSNETNIVCNENLLKPIWNGSEWIEGATPEEIAEQELEQQKFLKQQQYEELLPTDWYVVRFIETGVKITEEILEQRQDIRNKYK